MNNFMKILLISFLLAISTIIPISMVSKVDAAYQPAAIQALVSTANSSTATLAGDAVFTGTGEDVSKYASVSIIYKSDVAAAPSGLSIQFSQDNTNWDVQLVGDLSAKTFQVHSLKPAAKYFRVVYTNGSAAQSFFRLQCIFHANSPSVLVTRTGQPQSTVDATPTRQTTHIDLDYARKHIPGGRSFFFFGFKAVVTTSPAWTDIHPTTGDIQWQTAAQFIEVVSTNVTDDCGREVTKVICDSRSNTTDGQYFDIDAQDGSLYRVWMDTDGGGDSAPTAGGRILTPVDISAVADTATGSGDAIAVVLNALSDFGCPSTGNGTIYGTDANAGTVTDADGGDLANAWTISTHAQGATEGIGVTSVEVHGLSATGVDQDQVILMHGTVVSPPTITKYVRLNKLHSETCGTYGGSHEGDITCQVAGGGDILSKMTGQEGSVDVSVQYGSGEAGNGYWTVPLGKVMYITRLEVIPDISGNKTMSISLYERENILDVTTPFSPRRVLWEERGINTTVEKEFKSHKKIKPLADIWFRATATGAASVEVSVEFYLLDEDADGA